MLGIVDPHRRGTPLVLTSLKMPDPQIFKVRSARVVQADANTLFKATYSGVPVYEMYVFLVQRYTRDSLTTCRMVKSVAIMRRRSDSWLNATQILKIAGFDKPQRTRVLEREVQKGEHEKVQGGYGKYQGEHCSIIIFTHPDLSHGNRYLGSP
jgi:KilA-N domain